MRLDFSWIEYIERLDNMNITIYEALAKYKKDDTLPYTEYFSLGYFSTKDLAENAIMLAKELSGFREFCDVDAIYTVGGTLGVFSDYEYAVLAKEKYSTWDIFIVHGVDNFGIGKVVLNERQWVDGFVTVYD